MTLRRLPALLLLACAPLAQAANDTQSPVPVPGAPAQTDTRVLEAGADVLQRKPPIAALNTYLDGFHFYNGHPHSQMEAHHYCSVLGEEMFQCVIYDGNVADAKLMGVEYIISERLFKTLPEAEKALWHSHVHEVKSGQLVAPGVPQVAEHRLMDKLVHTYGKTWHTWHTDQNLELPLGVPQLMMGFTADGQLDPKLLAERDRRLGISSSETRAARADLPTPAVAPGANAWQQGQVIQLQDPTGQLHKHDGEHTEKGVNTSSSKP